MRASPSLLLVSVGLAACTFDGVDFGESPYHPGWRSYEGCPLEVDCSEVTPDGLRFRSLSLAEIPYITAVGGTQTFEIYWPSGELFDLAFTAESAGTEMAVEQVNPAAATIEIAGLRAGANMIEIRDSAGLLYDQVWLMVKPIEAVAIPPLVAPWLRSKVFAPSEVVVEIELRSPDGRDGFFGEIPELVADESAVLYADDDLDGVATVADLGFARFALEATAAGTGTLVVHAANFDHEFDVEIVSEIDGIGPEPGDISLEIGEVRSFCPYGLSGDAFFPVIGIDFDYSTTGSLELRPSADGCTGLLLLEDGPATLSVSAHGQSQSWTIVVRN